jgi:hypothetical protein
MPQGNYFEEIFKWVPKVKSMRENWISLWRKSHSSSRIISCFPVFYQALKCKWCQSNFLFTRYPIQWLDHGPFISEVWASEVAWSGMRRMFMYGELRRMRKGAVWPCFRVGPFFGTRVGGQKIEEFYSDSWPWGDIHIRHLSKTKMIECLTIA